MSDGSLGDDLFRLLVSSVRDYAIFHLDVNGRVASWNTGAERIKGYRADEIIGRSFEVFYPPEDLYKCARELEVALRTGSVEDEGYRVRKDGTRFWANVVITALFDRGKHIGFAKVTRDLTDRRRIEDSLRRSEERFRLLVDSVRDYEICTLDPRGTVLTWNGGAERLKGYTADEIVGRSFRLFYTPEDLAAGKCDLELDVAAREGRFEDEGWRLRKDGSRFWANVVITRLENPLGELLGFAKVTRDLTDKRAAEEERIRLAHSNEALRLRDEFLSIASHELRTPLTALKLQVQSLLHERDKVDPRFATKLERIDRATLRITQLVETLLDVSRIATGRLALQRAPVDLSAVVGEVVERHEARTQAAKVAVTLHMSSGAIFDGDRLRIDQVVANLLDNAIKYGEGTPIDLTVRAEADAAVLTVEDRGPGVPEEKRDRIFDRFERAASHNHGGLGLGLYVSREIVEAHGGTISVDARPGGGASFMVRLPLVTPR